MFLMQRSMIEPGVRYLPHVPLAAPHHHHHHHHHMSLEAAVDLTKKSEDDWRPPRSPPDQLEIDDDRDEDSDSDTPLDMSVTSRLTPVFPGFNRDLSPARSDRSTEQLQVRLTGLYSPGIREWSAERSEADKDEFTKDGCHICGMPKSEMAAYDHVEGACNQRPISCPLCSKTFSLWSHFESHKKCHQKLKQRQYPCQACGKIFTSASNRNMHQRIHKGVRPFHCIPCGVYFRQKAHLQKHQRTQGHIQATDLFDKKRTANGSGSGGGGGGGLLLLDSSEPATKREEYEGSDTTRSEDSAVHSSLTAASSPETEAEEMAAAAVVLSGLSAAVTAAAAAAAAAETGMPKYSPKRKQSHPQQQFYAGSEDEEESPPPPLQPLGLSPREAQISSNIEYNTLTHGYDCRQCDFSSPDHSTVRDHVATDHMRETADLQCKECMITFTKPFNLLIHNRKHETASQFLPCEFCEQVFKVPNKLIKHMEGVHCVCPTCGQKHEDKTALLDHLERAHNEPRNRGVHLNIQHLTGGAPSMMPLKYRLDMDSRSAKMRKVDSLAEHIRAKQLKNANSTNFVNGNSEESLQPHHHHLLMDPARLAGKLPPTSSSLSQAAATAALESRLQGTASDGTAGPVPPSPSDHHYHHLYTSKPGLESLVSQLNRMSSPLVKSENNNILSSLSKMADSMTPNHHHHRNHSPHYHHRYSSPSRRISHDEQPDQASLELTPPCSPPTAGPHITSHVTLINNNPECEDSEEEEQQEHEEEEEDSNETGLDLTLKKEPKSEMVVADAMTPRTMSVSGGSGEPLSHPPPPAAPPPPPPPPPSEDFYRNRPLIAASFPYIVPSLPFLTRMPAISPLPPHTTTSFTEHLFKLASISHPMQVVHSSAAPSGNGSGPQDLSKPVMAVAVTGPAGPPPPPHHHHTVLSAMLGHHHHRPPPPPAVFPVFAGGLSSLPSSMFPQHPLPPRPEERPPSPVTATVPGSNSGSDSKPFRCSYCSKEFGHLSSLESHVERLHTNESKHHCEMCGRAFSSKSNLTAHKKIHTGERPFECAVCKKRFRQKAHLQKHETTHSSATPYQCPHCDKAFGHPSNLNTHISTHSDIRPYECTDCGKAYKDSASFKRHRLVHTGERPHPCSLCPDTFIDSKGLKRHREAIHPTAAPEPEEEEEGQVMREQEPEEDEEEEEEDYERKQRQVSEEEEEELIEPGHEEQFVPRTKMGHQQEDEGVEAGRRSEEEEEEDDGEEGGALEIAETSADSGINSSLDASTTATL